MSFVGLAHRGTDIASALPYGEQRLVELAVALAARPSILLLDEPAAGMTGVEKDLIGRLIRSISDPSDETRIKQIETWLPEARQYYQPNTPPGPTAPGASWYYCPSAKDYYPMVQTCPEAWVKVPPRQQ